MKKFLAIILVLMLAFSMLLATACNNNTADTDIETSSTTPEETSSGRKRGEGAGSDTTTSDLGTTPSGGDDPNISVGDEPGNDSQNPPQENDFEFGKYDYSYSTSVTNPTETTSEAGNFDMLIYMFAQDFSSPSLSDEFYDALVSYESSYNALSATDKGLVQNYKFLFEARTAYNNMAKQECEKLISTLPDASIENLDEFSVQSNAIQKLINNLGSEANNISNKAIYEQKVAQIDSLFVESFNQKVAEVRTFEYTPAYKAKLDSALTFYNNLTPSQKSSVNSSYLELSELITKYEDTGVVNAFNEVYNKLPAPSAVVKEDKTNIELARTMYNEMSNTQLELLGNYVAISQNLDNLKTAINVLCPEFVWARSLESNKGSRTKTFQNSTLVYDFSGSSTNSGSAVFTYDGKSLTESFTFNANGSFKINNVPYGGKLVLYVTHYNSKLVNVTVSGGTYTETKELGVNEPLEFNIPSSGNYTISFSDKVKVYAVVFS